MFEIYVPFFNSTFCAEYQAKTLKTFIKDDDVQICFIDNNMGRYPAVSTRIEEICGENGFAFVVNKDPMCEKLQAGIEDPNQGHIGPSDKLGWTLNCIWALAKQRKAEYFGFLDQDCFAFRPVRLKEYLDQNGAYGKVVPTHPDPAQHLLSSGKWAWNLHVIANFYKTEFLLQKEAAGGMINFLPGSWGDRGYDLPKVILDTGGMNWYSVWQHEEDRMKYVLPEKHYFYYDDLSLLDPNNTHPTRTLYEIIDDKWVHMVHGATGGDSVDILQPKSSYIKGFLDLALMNEGAKGARPRNEFTGTYYEKNLHKAFDRHIKK